MCIYITDEYLNYLIVRIAGLQLDDNVKTQLYNPEMTLLQSGILQIF